jgi:hypothetical protein
MYKPVGDAKRVPQAFAMPLVHSEWDSAESGQSAGGKLGSRQRIGDLAEDLHGGDGEDHNCQLTTMGALLQSPHVLLHEVVFEDVVHVHDSG